MRCLSHQWSDKKPFTRRVRWYAAGLLDDQRHDNIRLCFEDADGECNRYYGNDFTRAIDYKRFKAYVW